MFDIKVKSNGKIDGLWYKNQYEKLWKENNFLEHEKDILNKRIEKMNIEIEYLRDYIDCLLHVEDLYNQLLKEYNELQQRIEKAVEYIKNDDNFWVALGEDCGKPNDDLDKLLNILNGRNDTNEKD